MTIKQNCTIGVDIGGTKIDCAIVNDQGHVLKKEVMETDVELGVEAIINRIVEVVNMLLKSDFCSISAIGFGIPGQVNNGLIQFAPNLKWIDIPFKQMMEKHFKIPICIANDVQAAAYGEWFYGNGKNCQNFVCLMMGTGIGGAIISNGKLIKGNNGSAGEFGHIVIDINGPSCTCGSWGCFEALASGWALARNAQKALMIEPEKGRLLRKMSEEKDISAKDVITAYREEDELAITIINDWIEATIVGCVSIVNAINPERLIMGGGLIEGFPELIQFVNQGVRERALASATQSLQIVRSVLRNDTGVIGASTLAKVDLKHGQ